MKYSNMLSGNIRNVPRSFIREILKTAISPDIISFAGGLPNQKLFPLEALKKASLRAFDTYASSLFQYSNSEGFLPLREFICDQYLKKDNLKINPDQILITNGSQQGLDLIAKVLINYGDYTMIEEPGYLGAIQSLSVMGAKFVTVPVDKNGANADIFREHINKYLPKLFYTVPAFQNPSGICYSKDNIKQLVSEIGDKPIIIAEDTPYSQIRFGKTKPSSFYEYLPEQTILLGSFSKTTVPGMRIGWLVAPLELMDKLIVAKQASDLHTDIFSQTVLHQYLIHENYEEHIEKICSVYGSQCNAMSQCIDTYLPEKVKYSKPEGGMFFWIELPDHISSLKLFNESIKQKVAFVPGIPFYCDGRSDSNTLRLNFSCSEEETIEEGIKRIGTILNKM